ncbi:SDR family NAD(P)-dependent oxidoreductase [Streptomyces macrosporus]|uniref:SDR family oxidoreductase n=1 Tax=Streptomyces macrosporus TaxID=44032 RepID=A0ABP5XGG2_9ACTN
MNAYANRKAVVTGGTHGMGRAIVDALLDGGAEVLLTGRDEGNLEAARAELPDRAHVVRSDVTDLADVDALAATVGERLGRIDFLFVNAGYSRLEPYDAVTEETYDRTFAVNAKGAFFTAQRLAPLVRDGGSIVFTTSVANKSGFPGMTVYAGAKAAVWAFAQGLAAELLPRGIRVNAVSPGFVRTPTMGVYGVTAEERAAFEKEGAEATPMGRIGSPAEVARAALFLAADATFTTGVELPVDGGINQNITAPHPARA